MQKAFLDQIIIQIKHFREEAGLTQADMAEKLKIGLRSYQRYESCESIPSLNFIHEASQILKFEVKDLFTPLEAIQKVGEITFFPKELKDEFTQAAGPFTSILFDLRDSANFKAAVSTNNLEALRAEPLFQDPSILLAVSTPKITLVNQLAQKELGMACDFVPTTSLHSSPKNVGILWGALLQTLPEFFIMKMVINAPAGTKHIKSHCIFLSEKGHYFILRFIKLLPC